MSATAPRSRHQREAYLDATCATSSCFQESHPQTSIRTRQAPLRNDSSIAHEVPRACPAPACPTHQGQAKGRPLCALGAKPTLSAMLVTHPPALKPPQRRAQMRCYAAPRCRCAGQQGDGAGPVAFGQRTLRPRATAHRPLPLPISFSTRQGRPSHLRGARRAEHVAGLGAKSTLTKLVTGCRGRTAAARGWVPRPRLRPRGVPRRRHAPPPFGCSRRSLSHRAPHKRGRFPPRAPTHGNTARASESLRLRRGQRALRAPFLCGLCPQGAQRQRQFHAGGTPGTPHPIFKSRSRNFLVAI